MKRLVIASLALVLLGFLILHQLGRMGELSARLAVLRSRAALEKIPRLPPTSIKAPIPLAQPSRKERLDEHIAKAERVMGTVPLLAPEVLFTDFPELETAFLKAKEGDLRLKYAAFFPLAGFTQQQTARFLEISMNGERDWIDLTKLAASRGVTMNDPEIKRLSKERYERRKQEMDSLLGPSGLALREKYRDERPARETLMSLAKASALTDQPMTLDQFNRLAALTTETGVFDNERPLQSLDIFSSSSRGASKILTPEQQQHFELILDARSATLLRALHRRK